MTFRLFSKPAGLAAFTALSLCFMPAGAQEGDDSQRAHAERVNAAFARFAGSGLSPQTPGEMAACSQYWNRWAFNVSALDGATYGGALNPVLMPKPASKTSKRWEKAAKKLYRRQEGSLAGFKAVSAMAAEKADELYAAWMNSEPGKEYALLETLGTCN